jgi:hypothetical protein
MADLADEFRRSAGNNLRLARAEINNAEGGQVLTLSGWRRSGHSFFHQSEPFQGDAVSQVDAAVQRIMAEDPLSRHLEAQTQRIKFAQSIAREIIDGRIARRAQMSRFGSLGDRLKTKREDREKWAEVQHARVDAVDAVEPGIRAAAESHIRDEVEGELAQWEDELRQLSNSLPLDSKDSGGA